MIPFYFSEHQIQFIERLRQVWLPMKEQPKYLSGTFQWKIENSIAALTASAELFPKLILQGTHFAPYRPGDLVPVKEAWKTVYDGCPGVVYRAGDIRRYYDGPSANQEVEESFYNLKRHERWRSPAAMPLWAVRYHLRVVSVVACQVQAMTKEEAACLAEGLRIPLFMTQGATRYIDAKGSGCEHTSPVKAFSTLWDSLHAKKLDRAWDKNPWCWKCEVEVVVI